MSDVTDNVNDVSGEDEKNIQKKRSAFHCLLIVKSIRTPEKDQEGAPAEIEIRVTGGHPITSLKAGDLGSGAQCPAQ